VAIDALTKIGGTPSEHPPYSPDLSPMRFLGFSNHEKGALRQETACYIILLKSAANGLQHVFEKWVERCKKCRGGTSKKRPSPHLHKVPTRSNKVSPRTFQTAFVNARRQTRTHLQALYALIELLNRGGAQK
jgi:hypothetical protein